MQKLFWLIAIISVAAIYFIFSVIQNLQTERNDVAISMNDPQVEPTSLTIAVIGDVHLPEGREPLAAFRELLLEVKAAEPDLVLLVGDYIREPDGEQLSFHRETSLTR